MIARARIAQSIGRMWVNAWIALVTTAAIAQLDIMLGRRMVRKHALLYNAQQTLLL
jgi:hypothetical protein